MDFVPQFGLGWLNGWLPFVIYVSIQIIITSTCPKEVKARLIDRKGWTKILNEDRYKEKTDCIGFWLR